ncbi:MAG: DUF3536 domain-containing protein [Chloroflexota bacterium]
MNPERFICIHGHFYQPPRENAWLEYVELEDSAYPYHDWNERITAECYAPNAASRILDREEYIAHIVNNYAKISFNFGPTLLAWLEPKAPEVYQAILSADKESTRQFSGHGSALAQAYNHLILPLANRRDKYSQVLWGIRDFEHRFGRKPEGMWLPETAVDLETLDILAELGIRFTILAPHQAKRMRRTGQSTWQEVINGNMDTTIAYQQHLSSGRNIALFFYQDTITRAVAFERLLHSGEDLARRLLEAFSAKPARQELVHIATDGETYGHHHRFGDMALAYALRYVETNKLARLTNYGEYLKNYPPTYEVEIQENTSGSCNHGVERWRSEDSCSTGAHPGWSQAWRAPLRRAMDWLQETVTPLYEKKAAQYLKDPWQARDDYISVILDRSLDNVQRFLDRHAIRKLGQADQVTVLKLLELERHALLMYTSCGWFFDDISDLGSRQVIQYAGRVAQLARELFGDNTEERLLELLGQAKSNLPEYGDGRRIYEKYVKPAMVDLTKVTAHYVVSSLYEDYGEKPKVYCYQVEVKDYRSFEAGRHKLAVGRVRTTSEVTRESAELSFGVLRLGDQNINAGVSSYREETYSAMVQEITQAFFVADFTQVLRLLDKHFGSSVFSLRSLFRDEQRQIIHRILENTMPEIEGAFRQLYQRHYLFLSFLADLGQPLPQGFRAAAEFILNNDLRKVLKGDSPRAEAIENLLNEAKLWKVTLDSEGLGYLLQQALERMIDRLASNPEDLPRLKDLVALLEKTHPTPFTLNLSRVQNRYYHLLQTEYPAVIRKRVAQGYQTAKEWLDQFTRLGELLQVRVPK